MMKLVERFMRTLLTLAAVLPGIVVGLGLLALRRDRRAAVHGAIRTRGRLGTRALSLIHL